SNAMKISKVREENRGAKLTVNAKTAVVSENRSQEGILYNDPSRYGKSRKNDEDRDRYIESRLKSSGKLYRIFNEDKNKRETDELQWFLSEIVKKINRRNGLVLSDMLSVDDRAFEKAFEKYAELSYTNRRNKVSGSPAFETCGVDAATAERLKGIISETNFINRIKNNIDNKVSEDIIDRIIAKYLKKSLCRERVKRGLKKLLMNAFDLPYSDPDIDVQRDFIDYVLEDFYHVRAKSQVSRSIKNMNMPVQPEGDGKFAITVSKGGTESGNKRSAEKEAFKKFLSDYASLDERVRDDMLRRMRRLVVLYFYGSDDSKLSDVNEKFDVWEDHAARRVDNREFIKLPLENKLANGKTDKDAERIRKNTVKELYRNQNIGCYRQAVKAVEEDNNGRYFDDKMLNMFFIHRIEYGVEKIYANLKQVTEFKARTGYLSEKIWKDLINYISIKYIAMGKAVYNYAMDELNASDKKEIELGKISEEYLSGISSFDYELIKAEEMLQRETAVYVAFAARHLSSQTVELDSENSDFLLLKPKGTMDKNDKNKLASNNILNFLKDKETLRDTILQYFGGHSLWTDFPFDKYLAGGKDDVDFLTDLKDVIYSMRNDSFHYATENHNNGKWNKELISAMFEHETERMTVVMKDKFYSNNLPMFYKNDDLKKLLIDLYKDNVERASQVPSFNKVFVRKNFPALVRDKDNLGIELDLKADADKGENELKFYNALYYMFKEIYYNAFLNDKNVRERFITKATKVADNYDRNKERNLKDRIKSAGSDEKKKLREQLQNYIAENDFGQRIKNIVQVNPDYTLAQICQLIMTEYNQQNNGCMQKKSAARKDINKDSYQHYKMLLLVNLRKAFLEFIKENYAFVLKPYKHDLCDKADFVPDFAKYVKPYAGLISRVAGSSELQKWYIVSRFLSPAQANHMLGFLHSYKQYVWDIYRRASETGTEINHSIAEDKIAGVDITDVDAVIDLSVKLCGTISSEISDYFKDDEVYAEYISSYLDFEYDGGNYKDSLNRFCNSDAVNDQKVALYYDGEHPKLNRNIILSKLYGERRFLEKITDRVSRSDIVEYYKLKKETSQYQTKGIFDSEDEQKNIKKFQEMKNIVEFRDLMDYSEIADELQGQLINWIYLRERDLMNFQLGYHYACLNNDSNKQATYVTLDYQGKKNRKINGAILYQICAMYINGLPLYYVDKDSSEWTVSDGKESTGAKIGEFYRYAKSFENTSDCYASGLEIFENISEHDNITELRNYIEHFRYYSSFDRSFLGIYSEVFDRFFTYDLKYRKNVPTILYNILLQHFVNVRFEFVSGKKMIGIDKKDRKIAKEKECARITIREKNGVYSEQFTYKLKNGTVYVDARDKRYLQSIIRLLFYPEKVNMDEMIEVKEKKKPSDNNTGKGYSKRDRQQDRKEYDKYKEKKKKEGNFLSGMGGNINWDEINAQLKN
nr:Chain A, LbaCas13a (C2c2) [Lachnospiraceae bacterium]5W1I_A Chain A, LbaCas13a (C2c2) [Lachnospiraceae bacterium]5W1I_C Chain C, LbaCas13a (C2c2) [Lachnospiraceae bacterium]